MVHNAIVAIRTRAERAETCLRQGGTQEELKEGKLAFLDCLVTVESDGRLETSVYRKDTHTDQYLLFDSHHPLIHKLGVIRTLFHRADTIPSSEKAKEKEREHLQKALNLCGYRDWTFHKALSQTKSADKVATAQATQGDGESKRGRNVTIPYVSGLSEKLRRIFKDQGIPVSFKPKNTLRQALVHPKDKQPKDKQSNIVYAIQCKDSGCDDLYIGRPNRL
ncbi:uncharacterized protein [Amphiura filiformis]|uniref:uncharacterized protein n=1 Tax=Amphiura filiformis TaxID=82378 RepID=UPI003B2131F2